MSALPEVISEAISFTGDMAFIITWPRLRAVVISSELPGAAGAAFTRGCLMTNVLPLPIAVSSVST
jgi:hypothetical protein